MNSFNDIQQIYKGVSKDWSALNLSIVFPSWQVLCLEVFIDISIFWLFVRKPVYSL